MIEKTRLRLRNAEGHLVGVPRRAARRVRAHRRLGSRHRILLPSSDTDDDERRVIAQFDRPDWEGNQTWFVTAGGATFAAMPLRVCGRVFGVLHGDDAGPVRAVLPSRGLRLSQQDRRSALAQAWDWGIFIAGVVPSLVFGVAFGNLLLGVPFQFDATMRVVLHGIVLGLLNPFALLAGVVSLAMLICTAPSICRLRTEGDIRRARPGRRRWRRRADRAVRRGRRLGRNGSRRLSDHRDAASDTAYQPAREDRERVARRMARQLRPFPWMTAAPVAAFAAQLGVIVVSGRAPCPPRHSSPARRASPA